MIATLTAYMIGVILIVMIIVSMLVATLIFLDHLFTWREMDESEREKRDNGAVQDPTMAAFGRGNPGEDDYPPFSAGESEPGGVDQDTGSAAEKNQ